MTGNQVDMVTDSMDQKEPQQISLLDGDFSIHHEEVCPYDFTMWIQQQEPQDKFMDDHHFWIHHEEVVSCNGWILSDVLAHDGLRMKEEGSDQEGYRGDDEEDGFSDTADWYDELNMDTNHGDRFSPDEYWKSDSDADMEEASSTFTSGGTTTSSSEQ